MAEREPTYLACRPHLLPVTEQRQTSCPSYLAVVATVRVASCRASRRQRSASYPCRVKAVVLHLASSSGSSSAAFPSSIAASAACSFDFVGSIHLASSYATFTAASSSFVATSFALADSRPSFESYLGWMAAATRAIFAQTLQHLGYPV